MTHPNESTENFYVKQLEKLVGGTIKAVAVDKDTDELGEIFVGLVIHMPNGKKKVLWLLSDDEGNAPGSFEVNDV